MLLRTLFCLKLVLTTQSLIQAQSSPQVLDDRMQLELFAAEPDIVTPVGATFDHQGRLLVIESHTHERPKDYEGPEKDRIRIVEDTDGDGKADRFRTFFEGTTHTMSMRSGPDNWIYVATRAKIFRIRDTDGDDRADEEERLVHLETLGRYPHNGLCGLAFDGKGGLYFGMGENLGVSYRMIGGDGAAQRGSGEGGVFRCDLTGKGLTRIATGFWNPFGICVDHHGRIFAVGNDADARPPSRLVQIVETGDYGFQYKYGRSGIHPLQAWDGELPGTLPMVSGTGEAPCELVIYNGHLITGAWGDFRVERYELVPIGASFQARREVVVQGDESFRPVAFAEAPDGSLFFTDWVDKSYPVHGKGRIWRLSWKDKTPAETVPELSDGEQVAFAALDGINFEALKSENRFLRQFAIAGLVRAAQNGHDLHSIDLEELAEPIQRLSLLQALRWKTDIALDEPESPPLSHLRDALVDSDPNVRLYAVRWVADAKIESLRGDVEKQLTDFRNVTPKLMLASIATLEYLDTGTSAFDPNNTQKYLLDILEDEKAGDSLKTIAIGMLPPDLVGDKLPLEIVKKLIASESKELQREVIRTMALKPGDKNSEHMKLLFQLSRDETLDGDARLTAQWAFDDSFVYSGPILTPEGRESIETVDDWVRLVGEGGNVDRGWYIFFRKHQLNCAACHQYGGRGSAIGPDLTGIVARTSRRDVLESIWKPSQDVAPHYVPVVMTLSDGRLLTGLYVGHDNDGKKELFVDSEGKIFSVDPNQVEERKPAKLSIMPDDIYKQFSVGEIRDLLALLEQE